MAMNNVGRIIMIVWLIRDYQQIKINPDQHPASLLLKMSLMKMSFIRKSVEKVSPHSLLPAIN